MDRKEDTRYTLEELASLSGYTRRTIRYYIAEGILSGPVTMGRGAEYTAEHLQRLQDIKVMQLQGKTIPEIRRVPQGAVAVSTVAGFIERLGPTVWEEISCARDVRVSIGVDVTPGRKQKIQDALVLFTKALNEETQEKGED